MLNWDNIPLIDRNSSINMFILITREHTLLYFIPTYRLLAPGTADGHDLFTVEGELLLEALGY
jgi:hypothetical protein